MKRGEKGSIIVVLRLLTIATTALISEHYKLINKAVMAFLKTVCLEILSVLTEVKGEMEEFLPYGIVCKLRDDF